MGMAKGLSMMTEVVYTVFGVLCVFVCVCD